MSEKSKYEQEDMFGRLDVPKYLYQELLDDFKRNDLRMAKLEMKHALLKARYIEAMDIIHKGFNPPEDK